MSQNINILATINAVEGFNPEDYAVDYTDLNTKETRKRLPVIAQIAWFRLKYPLGINLRKNVFCCPKCGLGGGMFDMYAYFANVPRKDVYKELCWKMGKNQGQSGEPRKNVPTVPPVTEEIESPLMDIESRHATYTALLSKLSLAKDHRDNLRGRGLLNEEIDRLG